MRSSLRATLFLTAAALLLALFLPGPGAWGQLAIGGQVTLNNDLGEEGTLGFGGRAHLSIPLTGITLQARGDFYSPDCDGPECSVQDLGVNVLWSLPVPILLNPYLGAGVAIQNTEGDGGDSSDYGVNFLAGLVLEGPAFRRFRPFGEARYQLMQDFEDQLVFSAGFLFALF